MKTHHLFTWGLIPLACLLMAVQTAYPESKKKTKVWTFQFLEIDEDGNAQDIPEDERVKIRGAKSTIRRSEERVCMTTTTRDLPQSAYTNWWVLFNDPSSCQNGTGFAKSQCGLPDVFMGLGDPQAIWATGGIVGPGGKGLFDACIEVGAPPPGVTLFGGTLTNENAEIHSIIKWHGLGRFDDSFILGEQQTQVDGDPSCTQDTGLGFLLEGNCPDPQLAVHPSPDDDDDD